MVADKPSREFRAKLVAQCAAGILASSEAWRAFESESDGKQSFEEWSIDRGVKMARQIWEVTTE